MLKIERIYGDEVLDSRGNPTVSVTAVLSSGAAGTAISPSGASTGKYEAYEKRDGDKERYGGKGVKNTLSAIKKEIEPKLKRLENITLRVCDKYLCEIDGTENKSNLGANLTLAVSMALSRALANHYNMPLFKYLGGASAMNLPIPMMNIINGGAHAGNNLDIQEFMIVPVGLGSYRERLRAGSEVYHSLKNILSLKGSATSVGDEGGFAPNLRSHEEAIELILEAVRKAGYSENDIKIALDAAASEWCKENSEKYVMPKTGREFTKDELIEYWVNLVNKYPVISIEDPFGEEDFESFKKLTGRVGNKIMIVGDDLFVTNKKRLQKGIVENAGNAILIKPNQIGTISETIETVILAKKNGFTPIISHRSGESEDAYIADLAVALNSPFIKAGAPARGERVAKYNRLLKISNMI